eukprot:1736328-Lingulodinium_polyedra.AAC.1
MSVETVDKVLARAATWYPPDETEGSLEIPEDDPQAEVGIVVRLPESTLGLDRFPLHRRLTWQRRPPPCPHRCQVDLPLGRGPRAR